jgi:hypothetical protein
MPHDTPVPPPRRDAVFGCVQFGRAMRLVSIEPHQRFHNLDIQNFVCTCGATMSAVIARIE